MRLEQHDQFGGFSVKLLKELGRRGECATEVQKRWLGPSPASLQRLGSLSESKAAASA